MDVSTARKLLRRAWNRSREGERDYWLVRFLFLRVLGFTYLAAFLSLLLQLEPLLGSSGLTPVEDFLSVQGVSVAAGFARLPTVFWLNSSDTFMLMLASLGLLISLALLLGYANVPMLSLNWFIYLSFVNVGQVWYGYGWETQLLETGFLAIFLVPLVNPRPFPEDSPPDPLVIWLLRWLAFRVHLGSGLIKLRGSECWRSLTCLDRYFMTQPIPNPASPYIHYLPSPIHRAGVLFTHFVQLVVPFSVLGSLMRDRKGWLLRNAGGVLLLSLQAVLIATGNLSFLNWVTAAAVISYFDDEFLSRFLPRVIVERAEAARQASGKVSDRRHAVNWLLVALVVVLSVPVVFNLLSSSQAMNASFNSLHLVNTYGAFGSVRPERVELVVEGTRDSSPPLTGWKEYDFRYKPDQVDDPLPVVAPYQPRIAWQMWFASMSRPGNEPWLMHLVWKLLHGDPAAEKLVKEKPFRQPPRHIRIRAYRFEYAPLASRNTWERTYLGEWMPPVSRNSSRLQAYVKRRWGG